MAIGAQILINPEGHLSQEHDVAGPSSLSNQDVVTVLSSVVGRKIKYVPVEDDMAIRGMKQAGMFEGNIHTILGLHRLTREGKMAGVTSTVKDITGKEPIAFEQFAPDYVDA